MAVIPVLKVYNRATGKGTDVKACPFQITNAARICQLMAGWLNMAWEA